MHFKKYILVYTIVPLLVITATASFQRFMVDNDYYVSYEGDCDPAKNICYIGCEDDECTEQYFYSLIERNAQELYNACGRDITDCEAAYECPESTYCKISYCDPTESEDECSNLSDI